MYYNKVEICGVNTTKLPTLKEKEKMEYLERLRAGDQSCREKQIGRAHV